MTRMTEEEFEEHNRKTVTNKEHRITPEHLAKADMESFQQARHAHRRIDELALSSVTKERVDELTELLLGVGTKNAAQDDEITRLEGQIAALNQHPLTQAQYDQLVARVDALADAEETPHPITAQDLAILKARLDVLEPGPETHAGGNLPHTATANKRKPVSRLSFGFASAASPGNVHMFWFERNTFAAYPSLVGVKTRVGARTIPMNGEEYTVVIHGTLSGDGTIEWELTEQDAKEGVISAFETHYDENPTQTATEQNSVDGIVRIPLSEAGRTPFVVKTNIFGTLHGMTATFSDWRDGLKDVRTDNFPYTTNQLGDISGLGTNKKRILTDTIKLDGADYPFTLDARTVGDEIEWTFEDHHSGRNLYGHVQDVVMQFRYPVTTDGGRGPKGDKGDPGEGIDPHIGRTHRASINTYIGRGGSTPTPNSMTKALSGQTWLDCIAWDVNGHGLATRDCVIDLGVTYRSSEGSGMTLGLFVQRYSPVPASWFTVGTDETITLEGGIEPVGDSASNLVLDAGDYVRIGGFITDGGGNNYPGNRTIQVAMTRKL